MTARQVTGPDPCATNAAAASARATGRSCSPLAAFVLIVYVVTIVRMKGG